MKLAIAPHFTFVAAVGDLGRFANPRQLMAYLGLVPSEQSSGERVVRGGITKTGNCDARRMLVEAAWSYRYPARVATKKVEIITRLPKAVRDIAYSGERDQPFRLKVITDSGDRDHAVHGRQSPA